LEGDPVSARVTLGLEEEVFVCEPARPNLGSLSYLARLTWSDPKRHYARTASNFARGADLSQGMMSCVEISTGVHEDPDSLVDDIAQRRRELVSAVGGRALLVPLGHLLQNDAPTNVAALQFHVGAPDRDRAYRNLGYALPLLALLAADSPAADGERFGQSYRMARGFAIGPLMSDPTSRFQDLIVSKRLGTIEVRLLDPVWDLRRVRVLARAIREIAGTESDLPFDREAYNAMRYRVALEGWTPELEPMYEAVSQVADLPREMMTHTAADDVWALYHQVGLVPTYAALDNAYRTGIFSPRPVAPMAPNLGRSIAGLAGYYVPKFPYAMWKYLKEK
jgi:gamma-glutamyl:cysteine ligase YbdK (ATP-grasp superfamily)